MRWQWHAKGLWEILCTALFFMTNSSNPFTQAMSRRLSSVNKNRSHARPQTTTRQEMVGRQARAASTSGQRATRPQGGKSAQLENFFQRTAKRAVRNSLWQGAQVASQAS